MKNKILKGLISLGMAFTSFILMFFMAIYTPWIFLWIALLIVSYGVYDYYNYYIKKDYLQEKDWRIY